MFNHREGNLEVSATVTRQTILLKENRERDMKRKVQLRFPTICGCFSVRKLTIHNVIYSQRDQMDPRRNQSRVHFAIPQFPRPTLVVHHAHVSSHLSYRECPPNFRT